MFPSAFPLSLLPRTFLNYLQYKGWRIKTNNLFFANGIRKQPYMMEIGWQILISRKSGDPWKDATVSAKGLNIPSTPQQTIGLSDGFHCSDLGVSSSIDPTVAAVQQKALASMRTWLATWRPSDNGGPVKTPRSSPQPVQSVSPRVTQKPVNAWFKKAGLFN